MKRRYEALAIQNTDIMKDQSTIAFLKMKIDGMIYEIKEADAEYWRWYCMGCYQQASIHKEKLDKLFTELADLNIAFLKEQTTEELNRTLTCSILINIGIPCFEANGSIYI